MKEKGRGSFLDLPMIYPPYKKSDLRQLKKVPNFIQANTADQIFYKLKLALGLLVVSSLLYLSLIHI